MVKKFATPKTISVLNHKLHPISKLSNNSDNSLSAKSDKMNPADLKNFQVYEFMLQNLKTFETSFFSSLFFYEPYVTDLNIEDKDLVGDYNFHIFHDYFPKRKVFF